MNTRGSVYLLAVPSTKIQGLASIDPRSVPLPNGTEVTTTVDKPRGDRIVPLGAVGRVVDQDGDRLTVMVVGVGSVAYTRDEVVPRRAGQMRFAREREEAEVVLRPCIILSSTVGSRAWGLADEGSDTDLRGVFLFPFGETIGLAEPPDVLVSRDGSETYWEFERTIRQLLRADPNTLETLFVPDVRALDPVGQALLDARDAFVSKAIYGSFGRYALSQAKKLAQSKRLAEHRGLLLDWLRVEPLDLDACAIRLADTIAGDPVETNHRAKQYIKQLYRSMFDQDLLAANDFASLAEFARSKSMEFELPRELRPKNAYNLLRLVACAVEWLRTGEPALVVQGQLRDRLRSIKRGEVPLETSLAWTEAMAAELDDARSVSSLPDEPDRHKADALLRFAREEAARRWFSHEPGPWAATRVDDIGDDDD